MAKSSSSPRSKACSPGTVTRPPRRCFWYGADGSSWTIATGVLNWVPAMTVVPCGVEHRTAADEEAFSLIFEPAGIRNKGDVDSPEFTAPQGVEL